MCDDHEPGRVPDDEEYTFRYTYEREPSAAIVTGIAAATDREPTELPPLHGFVDPDALDALVTGGADGAAPVEVRFTYDGAAVRVASDGRIAITLDPDGSA